LVRSSKAGDQEAITALFTWIRPAIVRYCRSRIGPIGPAYVSTEDVVQEVCMAALGALDRYGDEPELFLPIVYGIAAHKVTDHYRRAGRDRSYPMADVPDGIDPGANPEKLIMAADLRERLDELLDTLPPQHREILVLRLIVGLSAQETGTAVGLTSNAVRVMQNRALINLRNALSPTEWDDDV
jgi:RNA polymerase sigma-70 factor, ECF subfamily